MKRRAISQVLVDASGHLFVFPEVEAGDTYEYIYREANGLRWDGTMRAIYAFERDRWPPDGLLRHIAATIGDACDEELHFTEKTTWTGVSTELRSRLLLVLP